ncbi:MAG TPA: hypothetical protein VKB58_05125 [Terriglobales bacterium]|jgi:hypothetical protein|nr:hypothetical protein [Terriglobales bacterium]
MVSIYSLRKWLWHCLTTLLPVLSVAASLSAQQKLDIDPLELVRQASRNEIKASDIVHYYMFKDTAEDKDHSVVREIVRTNQGGLWTTLLINGKPLNTEERQKDNERLEKFANNPEARRKRREANKAEDKRAALMLSSLPDAFLYIYDGTDHGPKGEELVRLKFRPNPSFNPPNHETAVYVGMQGDMIVDRKAMRIAKIDGTLFKDVDFGWGILGRLYKGGKFIIVQRDIGNGDWEEVQETLHFNGKILMVKSLTVSSNETMSDFRPVSPDITTAQALDLLHKSTDVVAEKGSGVKEAQNNSQK